ncbi:MAG: PKD domain-containing protein [Bacteroidota bacterium]
MRLNLIFFLLAFCFGNAYGQITYTAADYAEPGDEFLLSTASIDSLNLPDFAQAGADVSWDFSDLAILTQDSIYFTSADNSGYQQGFIFTCVASGGNIFQCNQLWTELVNLGIKGELDINLPNIPITDIARLTNKSNAALANTMVGLTVEQGGFSLPLTNVYTDIDTLYRFPMEYQNQHRSTGRVIVGIQDGPTGDLGLATNTVRNSVVEGYGSLVTPYRSYGQTLKLKSTVLNTDTLILDTIRTAIPPNTTVTYEWFDLEYGVPVLSVTATQIGNFELVTNIQFIDTARCLEPLALYLSTPLQPIVDINGNVEVTFTNQSLNADSLVWDFGDGQTSTEESPVHTYSGGENTYIVQLIACNTQQNCTLPICDTLQLPLTIQDTTASGPIDALFTAPAEGCQGNPVVFQNSSDNASRYLWNFGDNNTSTNPSPTHSYQQPGEYKITLIASNRTDVDSSSQSIVILPAPEPALGNDTTINIDGSVVLSPGTFSSYLWSDGTTGSSISLDASQLGQGTFLYAVTVTDEEGCSASDEVSITVRDLSSLAEVIDGYKLEIFPSPVQDWLHIQVEAVQGVAQPSEWRIALYDLSGKMLLTEQMQNELHKVDLSNWPAGVYLLRVQLDQQFKTFKIVR